MAKETETMTADTNPRKGEKIICSCGTAANWVAQQLNTDEQFFACQDPTCKKIITLKTLNK